MAVSHPVSRRGLFTLLTRPLRGTASASHPETKAQPAPDPSKVAVIQGRFCLAYTSVCTVCSERCPEPGAIVVERGLPMVVANACTGCGVCHEVCPAPRNAVLVISRRGPPHGR